jgi:hypothetical protein
MEMNDPAILLEEINNQMNRLKDLAVVDYKKELLANNYPIIKSPKHSLTWTARSCPS